MSAPFDRSAIPATGERSLAKIGLRMGAFRIPPVKDAIVVGRRSAVGPKAMLEALETLSPGKFEILPVANRVVEAVIVRKSDLLKIPERDLVSALLRQAAPIMDETESLHVAISFEILISEDISW